LGVSEEGERVAVDKLLHVLCDANLRELQWQDRIKKFTHEVEHATKVESCFVFKKYDRVLVAESSGQPIVIELKNEVPLTFCV